MSTLTEEIQSVLPKLDKLGVIIPPDTDASAVASSWTAVFAQYVSSNNIKGTLGLLAEDSWWRDMLAMTWDFRTFHGPPDISRFLQDRLALSKLHDVQLVDAVLQTPFPDLGWITGRFTFKTALGSGDGVFNLIPQRDGHWKAFTVYTNLSTLTSYPEKIGSLRNMQPNHGKWKAQREKEMLFIDADPKVLVVGAGQCGLTVAARLKMLDVPTLVVDSHPRVGDIWRDRYETLSLHNPLCEFP